MEVVNSSGLVIDTDGEVTVEQLWDDGARANRTTLPCRRGLATYETVPDAAHNNSTMNLVVTILLHDFITNVCY